MWRAFQKKKKVKSMDNCMIGWKLVYNLGAHSINIDQFFVMIYWWLEMEISCKLIHNLCFEYMNLINLYAQINLEGMQN